MAEEKKYRITTMPSRSNEYYKSWELKPEDIKRAFADAQNGYPMKYYDIVEKILPIDGHLSGDLHTRKDDILALDYEIIGDTSAQVDFIKSVMDKLGYYALAEVILDSVLWGFKVIELDWDSDGKNVFPFHFYAMDNKYFKSVTVDQVACIPRSLSDVLIHIKDMGVEERLRDAPLGKYVIADFTNVNYRRLPVNFTKMGIAAQCMFYSLVKFYNIQDWSAHNEKFGMPHVDGTYADDATQETIDALEECVHGFAQDGSGVHPESTNVKLIENKSGSGESYDKLIVRVNKEQSKIILGAAELSELGDKGARAATEVQDGLHIIKKISDIRYLQEVVNKQIIDPILKYNFGATDPSVKLRVKFSPPKDLLKSAQVIREAYEMGYAIPDDFIASQLGIPKAKEGESFVKKTSGTGLSSILGG